VVGPDGNETTAPLGQVAPGRYVADVPADAVGSYSLRVAQSGGQADPTSSQVVGFGVDRSPEYEHTGTNSALLGEIARATGGELLTDPAASVRHNIRAEGGQPIGQWLVVAAALLFLGDVAARRIRVPVASIRRAVATAALAGRRWRAARPLRPAGARLLAAKQRAPSTPLPAALAYRQKALGHAGPPAGTARVALPPRPVPARAVAPRSVAASRPSPARPTGQPSAPAIGSRELGSRLLAAKQRSRPVAR
jgi:hypothetical protein